MASKVSEVSEVDGVGCAGVGWTGSILVSRTGEEEGERNEK
jgi:hypothetical protein